VATFFAVMKDTDYASKKVFVENFWKGFRRTLKPGNKEIITEFVKCDFTNIYNWNVAQREKKKLLTTEARLWRERYGHARCGWLRRTRLLLRRTRRTPRRSATRRSCATRPPRWTDESRRLARLTCRACAPRLA
jgi:hypothetical protein